VGNNKKFIFSFFLVIEIITIVLTISYGLTSDSPSIGRTTSYYYLAIKPAPGLHSKDRNKFLAPLSGNVS
jgi:hypothetical protein